MTLMLVGGRRRQPASASENCPSGLLTFLIKCAPLRREVCVWEAALLPSSRCSGVSWSQEVIEFPLLKIPISAAAGNPSEMKWTADVYV